MEITAMTCHCKVRDFVVGIDYDSIEEDKGHMTLRRKVSLDELIEEIKSILLEGSHYPQFPLEANPTITYAWDLNDEDDGDCYHEIINKLERYKEEEVMEQCLQDTS